MDSPSFVHGTTYYHFANPSEELAENFDKMRHMGLNTVRVAEIWPGWEVLEREPGRFAFEELDDYVRKAHAAGLGVAMGIGINNPPFWVFEDFRDVRCVDVSGKVVARRVQAANHDHVEYRHAMARFIEAHVKHYANMPGIVAWQFGNEMRYNVDIADNECSRVRFRHWLHEQFHGDLLALNRAWGVHYRTWEEIFPYQCRVGAPTQGLSPLAIASRRYQAWSIEELLHWGAALVKKHSALPVFHNSHGHSGHNGSHWRLAEAGDIVVQDIYPTQSGNPQVCNAFLLDCATSIARSQKKPLWIGETSVGQYGTFKRDRPPQELIEALVVEMLGCGIDGLLYFRHKPPKYEQPHKFTGSQTVLRRDGSATEYIRTPQHVAEVVERLGERLRRARPVSPEVAVYYPEESLLFAKDAGYDPIQSDAAYGASALWNRLGVPVHILPTAELLREDLSAFKLIYLPVSYLLPAAVGARLAEYVRAGGTLLSEARPGYVDELGWLYERQPGAGLAEVFGGREDLFWNADKVEVALAEGAECSATFPQICQTFRPESGQPIAWNDRREVVGLRNAFGRGTAVLLGFAPSLLFPVGGGKYQGGGAVGQEGPGHAAALRFIGALAATAAVRPPAPLDLAGKRLSVRYCASGEEMLVFLCNHGDAVDLPLPSGASVIARSGKQEVCFETTTGAVSLPRYGWAIVAM